MPKSYIGGFEKIVKKNDRKWDEEDASRRNDKYKNKRQKKPSKNIEPEYNDNRKDY